jgi:hypothetical protein
MTKGSLDQLDEQMMMPLLETHEQYDPAAFLNR